jgi:hypothetical protein
MRKKSTGDEFRAGTTVSLNKFLPYGLLLQKLIEDCFRNQDTNNCQSCTIKALGYEDVCMTLKRRLEKQKV